MKIVLTLLLTLAISTAAWASSEQNCIDLQLSTDNLEQWRERGQFRWPMSQPVKSFTYSSEQPFSDYLSHARELIRAKNPKAEFSCPLKTEAYKQLVAQGKRPAKAKVVDLLAPFELTVPGSKSAILLVHGLTDSTFLLHDLAAFFYEQGLTVRTLLLPGHGTAPGELLTQGATQWFQAVRYALVQMDRDFEQVYLGGYSMGAALLMDEIASRNPIRLKTKGLFVWSPASKSRSSLAWVAPLMVKLPFSDWLDRGPDVDFAKYESFPYQAGAEVYRVMKRASKKIKKNPQNIPLFMVMTQRDETINPASSLDWIDAWHRPDLRPATAKDTLVFYGMSLFGKEDWVKTIRLSMPDCRGQFLCDRVEGISHIATTSSPYNPHYGLRGAYRFCEHYQGDNKEYRACKESSEYRWGVANSGTIKRSSVPLRRLTFNPYFFEMSAEMKGFLERTGHH